MKLSNDLILVKELKDNLIDNGIPVLYDDTNSYMFVKIEAIADNIKDFYNLDDVLVIRRVNKTPFLNDSFLANKADILMTFSEAEYNKIKAPDNTNK